jgi:YVTN family beta-propeller protein
MSAGPYPYVPNEYDNTVSVIDTSSDTVVATIPIGGKFADTAAISPDGSLVYVASESGQVAVISTATNSVVTIIPVPGDLWTVAVSPDGSLVYAANVGASAVSVIDAKTNTLITNIPVASGPYGIAFSPDGTRAYVASESGTVSVISTATNSVLTTINVGTTPTMLAMSPDGQRVYVDNNGSGTVSVIDTSNNLVTATINVGGGPYGIVFSPDGSRAYVANSDGNVSVINTATNSLVDTINLGVENVGIAVSPDGTHLYVTHYGGSRTVSVIDTATDSVVSTINVGNVPEYLAIGAPPRAPAPDNFAYEVTGNDLFGIVDLNTGVFTSVGSTGLRLVGLGSYGGIIYGAADGGSTLYSVNTSTGALTAIGTGNIVYRGFGSTTSGLYAFGANGDLYSINPANGAATDIGPTGLSFGGIVMGMSSGSSTLYLTQNNSLYSLNTTNGSATLIGTTNEGETGFGALVSVGGTLYGGAYGASTPDIYTIAPQTGTTTFVAASPSTPFSSGVAGFWGLAPFDTTIPTLTAVTESPSGGDLNAGKTVMFMLTTSEAVTVTGTPTAMLNDGGTATYSSVSADGKTLTFTYTVGSTDSNVTSLQVSSINLPNGATIQDSGGNNLNLSLSAVPTYSGPQIDTTIPAVTAVAETPSTGNLTAGKTVTITLTTSEAVTVAGTPTLTLNDHGMATYSGISTDGKTLTFAYTVASADIDVAALQVSSINLPNGATIRDGGSNNLNLSLSAVPTYSGPAVDQDKVAEVPSLTTSGNVTVSAGGSKSLGITVMPNDSDDTLSVKISNVPSFETITAPNGDVVTRNGNTYTITAPTGQAINNLMVHSSYNGKGHPQNTFNITATNLTVGETATSASKSIIVTDPPPTAPGVTPPSLEHVVALFNQFMAAGLPEQQGGAISNALSQIVTNEEPFLAQPHHG